VGLPALQGLQLGSEFGAPLPLCRQRSTTIQSLLPGCTQRRFKLRPQLLDLHLVAVQTLLAQAAVEIKGVDKTAVVLDIAVQSGGQGLLVTDLFAQLLDIGTTSLQIAVPVCVSESLSAFDMRLQFLNALSKDSDLVTQSFCLPAPQI